MSNDQMSEMKKSNKLPPQERKVDIVEWEAINLFEFLFPERQLTAEQEALVDAARWPDDFDPSDPEATLTDEAVTKTIYNRARLTMEIMVQFNEYLVETYTEVMTRWYGLVDKTALEAFEKAERKPFAIKLANQLQRIDNRTAMQLAITRFNVRDPDQIISAAVGARILVEETILTLWTKLASPETVTEEQKPGSNYPFKIDDNIFARTHNNNRIF